MFFSQQTKTDGAHHSFRCGTNRAITSIKKLASAVQATFSVLLHFLSISFHPLSFSFVWTAWRGENKQELVKYGWKEFWIKTGSQTYIIYLAFLVLLLFLAAGKSNHVITRTADVWLHWQNALFPFLRLHSIREIPLLVAWVSSNDIHSSVLCHLQEIFADNLVFFLFLSRYFVFIFPFFQFPSSYIDTFSVVFVTGMKVLPNIAIEINRR